MRRLAFSLLCLAMSMAFTAPVHAAAPSTTTLTNALEHAVESDSQAWFTNRFDVGSVTDVEVLGNADGGGVSIRGNYTFNGGQSGWVRAVYARGKVLCLEFWDRQGNCDSVRGSNDDAPGGNVEAEDNSPWERLTGNMTEILVQPESDASCLMSKTIGNGGNTRVYSNRTGVVGSTSDHAFTILVKNTCGRAVRVRFPGFLYSTNDVDIRKGDVFSLNCDTTTTMGSDTFSIPHSNEACSGGHFLRRNAQ
jgi:hypothetical protein